MLSYIILCYITLNDIMSHCNISYYVISYNMILCHIMSHHIISYCVISYYIISHHIISYHIISYCVISYYIISHHIILCDIISYHVISDHIIFHGRLVHHIVSYHIVSYRNLKKSLPVAHLLKKIKFSSFLHSFLSFLSIYISLCIYYSLSHHIFVFLRFAATLRYPYKLIRIRYRHL